MRARIVSQDGSMLPIFIVFVSLTLFTTASAANVTAVYLETQRLQFQANQSALQKYASQKLSIGETAEVEVCSKFKLPINVIGLPAEHNICARSAAR